MNVYNRLKRFEWFRNRLIRNKITLVYVPLIIIPLFVLGFASNQIYTNAIVERTVKSVSDNSSLIITQINGKLANAVSAANMLTLNMNKVLVEDQSGAGGQMSELQLYTKITNQLSFALVVFPDVESAAFIDPDYHIFGSNTSMESKQELAAGSELLRRLQQSNGANIWFPMQKRNYLVKNETVPILTLGKRIVNINTGVPLGYVILNIRESALSAVYEDIGSIKEGSYYIADTAGRIVSSKQEEEVLQPITEPSLLEWVQKSAVGAKVQSSRDGDMLLISSDMQGLGWKLISQVPYDLLTEDTRKITKLILLIGLVCFVIALFVARLLSNVISKPIVHLSRHMKKVKEGNLDQQIEVNSGDEIGLLASGFNTMMGRVKDLLANISAEQKKKREYELALMQAQIKPHFLYNTLDVIYTLSEMGRARDVQRTTKALADFYRVALSQGKDQIRLEEELRSVKDYLSIQRIRYSDVFNYEMDVEPGVLGSMIPKLTIQPLVENAIYHGLKNKATFGLLTITARREEQKVVLTVKDDGAGMTEERLHDLRASMSGAQQQVGYGLSSVHERILLYFGEPYGIQIESESGLGTTVTAELPYQAEQER
ncbi:two-component system sensor histidine kinase YesM [Paenibacillus endophyticus]|uniref:histidine kinase n=1 Tax=Paenibacillus endophyticus TaxID=1294268 RepID=A0A7W5C9F8_9BACL|nr:sensor histidine kinase [Paenibacillus endophyticus]MBB3153591.1 two-component system sensor histidine kinase YesM [Paenibacillus endophyticus]